MTRTRKAITATALLLMFCNRLLPPIGPLSAEGLSAVSIAAGVILLLVFVDFTWPLFAAVAAYAVNGIYTVPEALGNSVGQSIFWFVILVGMVLAAAGKTGVIRQIACRCLALPVVSRNPWALVAVIYLVTLALGCVMDPTALILLMTQPVMEIFELAGMRKGDRAAMALMVGLLTVDCWSYGVTPIGHPLPMVMIGAFSELAPVDFGAYSLAGMLGGILWIGVVLVVLRYGLRIDLAPLEGFDSRRLRGSCEPMGRRGKAALGLWGLCIAMWLIPSFTQATAPSCYAFFSGLGVLPPLVLIAVIMALVPVEGKPLMDFAASLKEAPWSAACVVGAALLVGGSLSDPELGITALVGDYFSEVLRGTSSVVFVAALLLFCTLLTNFTSDMVTALLCSSLAIMLISGGVIEGVNTTALCVAMSLCACCAYMTPPACAQAAIVTGQGYVAPTAQFKVGALFAALSWLAALVLYIVFSGVL